MNRESGLEELATASRGEPGSAPGTGLCVNATQHWLSPEVAAEMIAFLASDAAGTLRGAWLPVFGSV
jgi:hypothetical protein